MSQTVLITGANRGIGLALAEQLRARGAQVIAVVRHASKELEALGVRIERGIDVTDADALSQLSNRLDGTTLDWLLANAGVLSSESLDDFDAERVLKQFEINALGPVRTVLALRKHLKTGAKIGLTTSSMGSVADNTSGGMYGYRMSKAALNMAGVSLAHDLKPSGIAVLLLHPGYVKTDMTRGTGQITPQEAASGMIARMDELTLAQTGSFRHQNGEHLRW